MPVVSQKIGDDIFSLRLGFSTRTDGESGNENAKRIYAMKY
jgi:hypothetical protein